MASNGVGGTMRHDTKVIVGGLLFIFILAIVVFLSLNRYMDMQTEKDVRQIADVYLQGVVDQEADRFESIKSIRFTQLDAMLEEIAALGENPSTDQVNNVINAMGHMQRLENCSLVSASGEIASVYGAPIVRLGDPSFLMEGIREGKQFVTGGWSDEMQYMIYASPLSVPMQNGEQSIGILWCKPASKFMDIMNLNSEGSLAEFHVVRRDTSYVFEVGQPAGDKYIDKVLAYLTPDDMTAQQAADAFQKAIKNNESFSLTTQYIDKEHGINEHRNVRAVPLKDSNWYLISVLPYGVLDETIKGMGNSRTIGMIIAVIVLALGILVVFSMYLRMTRRQVAALEEATHRAQDALARAEEANKQAVLARNEAELARQAAENANKAKSEFLSNMSHDIRTPMNAIVGLTSIARNHLDDRSRVDDALKKISLSSKQLLGLINDVLYMSKIESGKMTLVYEELSLRETLETICDIVRPQVKQNGQHFDVITHDVISEEVYCDGVRLNQVLLNFLSNALKFTPQDGVINIELWQEQSEKGEKWVRTHFAVTDTGIGMNDEFKEKLFQAFEREDNLRVHKTQGSGLGLSISKYIIDAMEGSIEVESEQGKGSRFHIAVDFERVLHAEGDMKLPAWSILVVDDNIDLCKTAEAKLTDLGCVPTWCLTGEEAIDLCQSANKRDDDFFAVLIDYKLKGMNGIETAVKIRSILGDDVPISLISAYDWSEIEEEAKAADITRFIPKPLFKSTLYRVLSKLDSDEEAEQGKADAGGQQASIAGMNILIAEDQEINAEIITVVLEEAGASVMHAEDGQIATEMFASSEVGTFDAILMDLRMPNMNGFEATQAIRAMERSDAQDIPIIAMTADAFVEDAKKCLEVGMNAHMAKPVDVNALLSLLTKYRG